MTRWGVDFSWNFYYITNRVVFFFFFRKLIRKAGIMPPQIFSLFSGDNCFLNVMLIFVLPLFCYFSLCSMWMSYWKIMKIHLGVSEKLRFGYKPQFTQKKLQKTQTKYEGKVLKVISNVKGTLHWYFHVMYFSY